MTIQRRRTGLAIAIFAGWFVSKKDLSSGFAGYGQLGKLLENAWLITIRFITPILIVIVILSKTGALDRLLTMLP